MPRFWLATYMVPPSQAAHDSPAAVLLAAGARNLAIEVLGDAETSEYAVLFSTVDDPKRPRALTCLIAFANGAKACSIWRDRGVPLVDARIVSDGAGKISVFSPYFGDDPPMQYESLLFAMTGITFEPPGGAEEALETQYEQALEAPDSAQPDTLITRRATTWTPERGDTHRLKPLDLQVEVARARYPSLAPLGTGTLTPVSAWSGNARLPQDQKGTNRGPILGRVKRADIFGAPAFRFENVEVLGFRVDLGAYGRDFARDLDRLIKPLNFHLDGTAGTDAVWDFRYRAASRTLVIELLRYGSMKLKSPSPPMGQEDYQSQHELVVRLLVGRVDDDTAQAHAPAIYVPAIFVDNPWSKVLGRDMQGFDKRMADFCVSQDGGHARLLPDGRVAGLPGAGGVAGPAGEQQPRPLGDISLIRLVETTGLPNGRKILDLDCSPLNYEDWDAFDSVDLGLALRGFALSGTRWRQSDFDAPEFRRSFARSAVTESLQGFRSIQVSPVADRGLDKAWITGTFTVDDDLRIARPSGVASLTIHAVEPDSKLPSAPSASPYWNLLCEMLGDGRSAQISLPTGSWYRLLCSMDLTIDDGLDWSGPNS
jgi:hypothetical protein